MVGKTSPCLMNYLIHCHYIHFFLGTVETMGVEDIGEYRREIKILHRSSRAGGNRLKENIKNAPRILYEYV